MKKRRARRKHYNWAEEIAKGNTDKFYNSTDFEIARERVLARDKYTCQFFLGKWNDGIHFPEHIKIIRANTVHHIISIKERPDLALDINNMISLSFEAHEIIEDRHRWTWRKKKKPLTEERW
jgi:5-methylcytosine-specific restriction endonuclease McrA